MPKVSVIIPTHNRPELLKRAVDSVLKQTYRDFEIIVIDDGSLTPADSVVALFNDARIRCIQHETARGGGAARNTGIRNAVGEFVAFLDDDDEWLPEKLSLQINGLLSSGPEVGYCFSAVDNVFEDKVESTSDKVPDGVGFYFERALSRFSGFLTVTLVVRRNVLEQVGYFDENLPSHQEIDLMIRIAKKFKGLGISKPLVRVNMTKHESIGSSWQRRIQGREMVLEKYSEDFKKRPEILASHYFQLGLFYRNDRQYHHARKYFKKAWETKFSFRYLLHYFSMLLRV